jgi:hypothetical protein
MWPLGHARRPSVQTVSYRIIGKKTIARPQFLKPWFLDVRQSISGTDMVSVLGMWFNIFILKDC